MLRNTAILAILLLSLAACKKKNQCADNSFLPKPLQELFNASTRCSDEGCQPYIQRVTLKATKYYLQFYDIGPLCDLASNLPNYYDMNGIAIEQSSDLYADLQANGEKHERVWQCCRQSE